ncbi:MAG: hypothetical protein AUJ54_09760 [Ignavibacteria bacterium CG1_02_37_35]|nr:MAG: hypothetical protein AUJ54_09760 [Ignavibacteria bacterium CG1_02_37_35]
MKIILLILSLFCISNSYSQNLFFEGEENSKIRNEVVAQVGSIKITVEEFVYSYEFGPAFPKRKKNSKLTHLNYMINEKLLTLEGYEKGVMEKESTKELFADIEYDLAAEEMFEKEIVPKIKINDTEINKVIETKQTEYQLRWLYARNPMDVDNYLKQLKNGISFDSLFTAQLIDSVLIDDRQLTSSLYNIYMKNPQFAQIVDTLKAGRISDPIHTDDGWYIIKIDNIIKNMITGEAEYNKLKSESISAITKSKMDILSDQYVKELFSVENPIIKRNVFNVLRSYLGKFILSPEKYSEWELDDKLDVALANLGLKRGEKYTGLKLVECKSRNLSLDEFIIWYRNREQYIKFNKNDLVGFSKSLEDLVWLMVRDKLLTAKAYQSGYNKSEWVIKQSNWWKDKISYSAYRNELANSITLNSEEQSLLNEKKKSQSEIMSEELSKKILHKVLELKKKYNIVINQNALDKIKVSNENDKKAIDMYIAKRGNLIPRPAFPSIDNDWSNWE